MTVKKFFFKLNFLAKYALRVTNSDKGKLEVFFEGLRSNITKNVLIEDNPLRTLLEALGKRLRLKVMKQMIAQERKVPH